LILCPGCNADPRRLAALRLSLPRANPCQRGTKPLAIAPSAVTACGSGLGTKKAPVAQLDRAPDYESGGQEFESLRARHQFLSLGRSRWSEPGHVPQNFSSDF